MTRSLISSLKNERVAIITAQYVNVLIAETRKIINTKSQGYFRLVNISISKVEAELS